MILKITNDFNLILNRNDYQAFVASIDLLSLHCPVCSAVGLFILYGHYLYGHYKRFVIIDDPYGILEETSVYYNHRGGYNFD